MEKFCTASFGELLSNPLFLLGFFLLAVGTFFACRFIYKAITKNILPLLKSKANLASKEY